MLALQTTGCRMSEQENVCLWKLYLWGRRSEYKLVGFIWARADVLPQSRYGGCTKWRGLGEHTSLCADIVQDTSHKQEYWMKPWPKEEEKYDG